MQQNYEYFDCVRKYHQSSVPSLCSFLTTTSHGILKQESAFQKDLADSQKAQPKKEVRCWLIQRYMLPFIGKSTAFFLPIFLSLASSILYHCLSF